MTYQTQRLFVDQETTGVDSGAAETTAVSGEGLIVAVFSKGGDEGPALC